MACVMPALWLCCVRGRRLVAEGDVGMDAFPASPDATASGFVDSSGVPVPLKVSPWPCLPAVLLVGAVAWRIRVFGGSTRSGNVGSLDPTPTGKGSKRCARASRLFPDQLGSKPDPSFGPLSPRDGWSPRGACRPARPPRHFLFPDTALILNRVVAVREVGLPSALVASGSCPDEVAKSCELIQL